MPGVNTSNMVFVFGSNLAGRHGAGAALYAMNHRGAKYGKGIGPYGQSFAIPTKDSSIITLPLKYIKSFVDDFIVYAANNPAKQFQLTCIGCGLAGIRHEDIAPMFINAPTENIWIDMLWEEYLPKHKKWGTF